MNLSYHFDGQLRRYILQIMGVLSGFQWETGRQQDGEKYRKTIPVKWGAPEKLIDLILRNNSENAILSVPQISIHITDIKMDADNRRAPNYVDTLHVHERGIDYSTNTYTETSGNTYSVERYMPVPYILIIDADIWTSNTLQKDQILEQILVLFNPSLDIQTSNNPIDWSSLTLMELTNISYSSRSVPLGTSDDIDIATLTFEIPIWINPPAKLKRQNIINEVITNINEMKNAPELMSNANSGMYWSDDELLSRQIVTPENHRIDVSGTEITLLGSTGLEYDANGCLYEWESLLNKYGKFRPNISQIRLKHNNNLEDFSSDMVGTLQYHPVHRNKLIWTLDIDTLKMNTLDPIIAIINPSNVSPGVGLPIAVDGQRYLLDGKINKPATTSWGIDANKGDIVQYHDGKWHKVFIASTTNDVQYIVNLKTNKQLEFDPQNHEWIFSIDGEYNRGYWRLFL